jgi:hypothetical protein
MERKTNPNSFRPRNKRRPKQNPRAREELNPSRNCPTAPGASTTSVLRVTTPLMPYAPTVMRMLYYEPRLTLTSTSGLLAGYAFSCNGAYDPNITGTGHQPIGFDQMMLLFEQYVVLKSHIKVTWACSTAATTRVGIILNGDSPIPTSDTLAMENGQGVWAAIEGKADPGAHNMCTLELDCDVAKYFGKTKRELQSSPDLFGNAAANPTEQVYFQILQFGGLEAVTATTIFDVILYYDIFFYEPRKLASS